MKPPHISWSIYLRNGFGRRLSTVGERLGQQWLIYNPLVMRQFHDEARRNAPLVASAIIDLFPAADVLLDVGCGSGAFAAEFNRLGRCAIGLERSPHGRSLARKQNVDCRPFDLTQPIAINLNDVVDVIYCLEVAEHMPPPLGRKLIEFIAQFRKPVIFSAAQPGQGGTGHVNEQPTSYWIEIFIQKGFLFDAARTEQLRLRLKATQAASWFVANSMVLLPS